MPVLKNIYLVRHISTEFNQSGVFMGRSLDAPILKNQIKAFSKTIRNFDFNSTHDSPLYSSPALRCQQTLNILKDELQIASTISIEEALHEANYGLFEGRNAKEIRELFPKQLDILIERPSRIKFPEGDSFVDVQERAYGRLMEIVKENQASTASIFVCTHVDIIKLLLFKVLGISIDKKRYLHIHNGSITCLEVAPEGIKLKFMNRV